MDQETKQFLAEQFARVATKEDLHEEIESLAQKVQEQFTEVYARFDAVDERFDAVDERLAHIEVEILRDHDHRINKLEQEVERLTARIT